jgi:hypothetical protein
MESLGRLSSYQLDNDGLPFEELQAFREFVDQPSRNLTAFTVAREGDAPITITDEIGLAIDTAISGEITEEGRMSGLLESINIHADANRFNIYPAAGPSRVVCHFPRSKLDEAVEALGKHVCVSGSFKYRKHELVPHEVIVRDIEIFPLDDQLPSLAGLRGIAPNATGDVDSVAFVRSIRNGGEAP